MSALYPDLASVAFAFEKLTFDNTAGGKALTSATYAPSNTMAAERAVISVEGNPVRYRYDGTAPDSTTGHLLNIGDVLVLESRDNLNHIIFISTSATNATIQVSYERG